MKQFCKQEFPAGSLRHTAHTAYGSSVINAAGKAGGARLDAGEGLQLIDAERWYVAHTQPHKEAVALKHLTEQGLRGFLPRQLKTCPACAHNPNHSRAALSTLCICHSKS